MKTSKAERIAARLGRLTGRFLRIFVDLFDDLLLLAGCVCILYGLSMWNIVVTWIVAGVMLIGMAVIVGKAGKDAST